MSHPFTDPFHTGLVQLTPSQRLMNADAFRRRGMPMTHFGGDLADSPLSGLSDAVGTVLGAAGYGRPQPEKQPVASDADPPSQAVTSDGQGNMTHVRSGPNGDTVTPVESGDTGETT